MRLFAFLFILFCSNALSAQSPTTSLIGTIKDAKDVLQGATVVAIDKKTGKQHGVLTDIEGHFILNNLASAGIYKICVSYLGYQTVEQSDVNLSTSTPSVFDVTLKEATNILEVANVVSQKKETAQEPTQAITGFDKLD